MKIREWSHDDLEQCTTLFNGAFGLSHTSDQFRWKYFTNPLFKKILSASIVAEDNGKIVGMYPCLPYKLSIEDKAISAVQVCDNCVEPAYRKQGIQKKINLLWKELLTNKIDFGFGFPNAVALTVGTNYLGYRSIATSDLFVSRNLSHLNGSLETDFNRIILFSDELDHFWETHRERETLSLDRTASYFNWRYIDNPFFTFECFAIRKHAAIIGYVVYRVESGHKHNNVYLYELCTSRSLPYEFFLEQVLIHLGQYNIESIMLWEDPNSQRGRSLLMKKFTIEPGHTRTLVCVPFSEPWVSLSNEHWPKWYTTIGDSDF